MLREKVELSPASILPSLCLSFITFLFLISLQDLDKMFRSIVSVAAIVAIVSAAPAKLERRQAASVPDFVLKYGNLPFSP